MNDVIGLFSIDAADGSQSGSCVLIIASKNIEQLLNSVALQK
jgi:hypothetical protein